MSETIELCTAGLMVILPTGVSLSLPHFAWSPADVRDMTEDDREHALESLRAQRDAILKHI